MKRFLVATLFLSLSAHAVDVPTGLMRTAEGIGINNYEIMISPSYTLSPSGMYLSSELRYQPNDELGLGFGFGAGEVGFNFGAFGQWYAFPDIAGQPAFSILGGLYINRINSAQKNEAGVEIDEFHNYFVMKVAPTVSKAFRLSWGVVTPYGGGVLAPSFRLDGPKNELSIRAVVGAQFAVDAIPGLRLMSEVGLSVVNSVHQIGLGLTYPLGGAAAGT